MKRLITASAFGVLLSLGAASPVLAQDAQTETTAVCNIATPCSAGDAGTIAISRNGAILTITDVTTNEGWRIAGRRTTGLSVEVEFRRGTTKLTFQAEVEDGVVEARIRTRTR
ncbi:MAG: hypothetical protein R2761_25935 [Acidimicrobiales bacterium]